MWVEIAYCGARDQAWLRIEVGAGATVVEALRASGLLERCPDIDLGVNRIGIWGVACGLDDALRAGDRIEVYRPLMTDPKHARRARARR